MDTFQQECLFPSIFKSVIILWKSNNLFGLTCCLLCHLKLDNNLIYDVFQDSLLFYNALHHFCFAEFVSVSKILKIVNCEYMFLFIMQCLK